MIDIVNFKPKENLGFSKILTFDDFKFVVGGDDKTNRKAVENKNTDILISPENIRKKDFMKYSDSGLNQVLCKLARENNVAIGFNFNDALKSNNRKSVLGKMMQNVKLCRKFKVEMVVLSGAKNTVEMRMPRDLISFGICLGMTPGEAKRALNFEKKQLNISPNL